MRIAIEPGRNRGNSRNGSTPKTVVTDIGKVNIEVPRDRDASFEPQSVRKHYRRLAGLDVAVISLHAKGTTIGEIARHVEDIYDTTVSRGLCQRSPRRSSATGLAVAPARRGVSTIVIDAIVLKIREGQVANRAGVCGKGYRLQRFS